MGYLCLVLIWGGDFKPLQMGFITMHEMEVFDIVTHKNYREVGLEIINGQQLGTFNARLNVCQANLGLDSTMGFRHFQCRCLTFAPTQY